MLAEFDGMYNKMARDYGLKHDQKRQYSHGFRRKHIARFYAAVVKKYAAKFQIVVNMITAQ